ncbi:MAG: hypothetical protein AAGD01_13520 [Acidobacteriota bacterium]
MILASLLLLGAAEVQAEDREGLEQRFVAAVRDAAVAEPFEVVRELKAINPYESGLVWRGRPGKSSLRMLAWVKEGEGVPLTVGETFVVEDPLVLTVVPELVVFCRTRGPRRERQRTLRLEQLLGLPPDAGKQRMVELWVPVEELFRRCLDPEVTDHECSLVTPRAGGRIAIDAQHSAELLALRRQNQPERITTSLGYTYDWGNPRSEVGLSEFVAQPGAQVEVHSVTPTLEYCLR